jgi:hypothetical protein
MKRKIRKTVFWVCAGAAAFGFSRLLGSDSPLAEKIYGRGLFAGFRWIWDYSIGLSPVPLLYLGLVPALAFLIGKQIQRISAHRVKRDGRWMKKIALLGLGAAAWAGALIFFFYVLWGFNYNRPGMDKRLGLDITPLESSDVALETEWAVKEAAASRSRISGALTAGALDRTLLPAALEKEIRGALTEVFRILGYPSPGRVRVRRFFPGGWMMRFSGSGIYLPYFGEGYLAGNLTPSEIPFTMAHEMAHGYGITDEGEANFLALLACEASSQPLVRYSGLLSYWMTAAGELGRMDRAAARALAGLVSDGMRADILALQANWKKFESPLGSLGEKVYEKYLRSQGVKEGLKSYSRFLNLRVAWRKKTG